VTWVGNNGFWDVASNWSTGVVPGANDDILIDTAGVTNSITIRTAASARTLLSNEKPRPSDGQPDDRLRGGDQRARSRW